MTSKYEHGSADWMTKNKITKDDDGNFFKKCLYSGNMKPIEAFSINPSGKFKGLYYSVCDANKPTFAKSNAKHRKTDKRKISQANHKKTDKWKISNKNYKNGAAGKATQKRNHESVAGKAQRERANDAKRLRRIDDPGWTMDMNTLRSSNHLISGKIETSPTFTRLTGWDHMAFRKHIRQLVDARRFDWKNHGNAPGRWNQEHRIPRAAYDFTDSEDIKRCWSRANLDVKTFEENETKADAILPEEVKMVPEQFWPKSWEGVMPDESKRLEIRKLARERNTTEAAMDDPDDDSDSDDDDSDDEPGQVETGAAGSAGSSGAAGSSSMHATESPDDSD
jgi:hypothetical protein